MKQGVQSRQRAWLGRILSRELWSEHTDDILMALLQGVGWVAFGSLFMGVRARLIAAERLSELEYAICAGTVAVGVGFLAAAYGLWRRRNWGWLTHGLACLVGFAVSLAMLGGISGFYPVWLVIAGVWSLVLWRSDRGNSGKA